MKAFVTGANGFTGSYLVKALLHQGYSVTGLVRSSSNLSRLTNCDIELVYGDITDRTALTRGMKDADVVFHTAAYVEIGLVDEAKMARTNVEGTKAVLEVARDAAISKLVYCSSIGIYGNTQDKIADETFVRTQPDFASAYDRTKYLAQQLVDRFAAEGLPVVSVMPVGIFGIGDSHFDPIVQLFLQRRLKFWLGGDRIIGIVHVEDLAQAMILAAETSPSGEHYIISSGMLSTREVLAIFSQETGIPEPTELPEWFARMLGNGLDLVGNLFEWNPPLSRERIRYLYDRNIRVDATKARQQLGWQPRSVRETLQQLVVQGRASVS